MRVRLGTVIALLVAVALQSAPVAAAVTAPTQRLLWNDPATRPHAISDALVRDLGGVPAGGTVDVATYWIGSARIADALVEAHQRGVRLRILLDSSPRAYTPEAARIEQELARTPGDGSSLTYDDRSTDTDEGIVHEKVFLLSATRAERWVVVAGSWNASDNSDANTHAAMWRVAGRRGLYDAFAAALAERESRMTGPAPARWYAGSRWAAYFLPLAHHAAEVVDPASDPVVAILRKVPARRSSQVRILMYSMWGTRAWWIRNELARIARGGGKVILVAGPTVDPDIRSSLRAAGAYVVSGCYPDGTFIHGKDMGLRYVRSGTTRHWTWIGSDNWSSRGTTSGQAVLGLKGRAAHDQFLRYFQPLARRTDGVFGPACVPRPN